MCIIFSYVSKSLKKNEFKLILVSNRDEWHHRPSKPASFVNQNSIYGIDLTSGKEGGTWFGANKSGKISLLLNLDKKDYGFDEKKQGRGFLVPDYLNSIESCSKYIDKIKPKVHMFNPFNLVFFEMFEKNQECSWFDSVNNQLSSSNSEFFSISNHLFENPYLKTVNGERLFKNVVESYNRVETRQELLKNLLKIAKYDGGKTFQDYMTKDDKAPAEFLREQIFINTPFYGTRTHTVVLIDDRNKIYFYENTMECPIESDNPKWIENNFEFDLVNDYLAPINKL